MLISIHFKRVAGLFSVECAAAVNGFRLCLPANRLFFSPPASSLTRQTSRAEAEASKITITEIRTIVVNIVQTTVCPLFKLSPSKI